MAETQALVSIASLETRLRLLRLPRAQLEPSAFHIIRTLWFRNSKLAQRFFSLTINTIEVSIFGEVDLVKELHEALQDLPFDCQAEISANDWEVLQIENHSDQFDDSGKRVRDLAKPLASHGISILFKSTYFSDFILVEHSLLDRVCDILSQTSGFIFQFSSDDESDVVSPVSAASTTGLPSRPTPMTRSITGSLLLDKSQSPVRTASSTSSPKIAARAPKTRRSDSQTSDDLPMASNSLDRSTEDLSGFSLEDANDSQTTQASEVIKEEAETEDPLAASMHSEASLNITSSLYVLPDELVCIGMDTSMEKLWREKLVKALLYSSDLLDVDEQDDVSPDSHSPHAEQGRSESLARKRKERKSRRFQTYAEETTSPTSEEKPANTAPTAQQQQPVPFVSFTSTSDNASLVLDVRLLRALFDEDEQSMVFAVGGDVSGLFHGEESEEWAHVDSEIEHGRQIMKCLQLDLSAFPLEKTGIVNHVTETLGDHSATNMLYSSTYSTACVLVSKGQLESALTSLERLA